MFDDGESQKDKDSKQEESMTTLREKQRQAIDEDVKKTRRDLLQSRRMNNMLKPVDAVEEGVVGVPLSHLANCPSAELLRPRIIEWSKLPIQVNKLNEFLLAIETDDLLQQHYGLIGLRKILSMKTHQPIQEVLDNQAFFKIFKMAQDNVNLHLQLEATWVLVNLASGTSEQTNSLIQKNVIELFVKLIQSPYPQIQEQAIWGIGNIAGDCPAFRTKVVQAKAPEALLELMNRNTNQVIFGLIVWTFSNICRLRPSGERFTQTTRNMINVLKEAFKNSNDIVTVQDSLFGLYSNVKADTSDLFRDSAFLTRLLKMYSEAQANYVNQRSILSAIHTLLGGFTSDSDVHTEMVVNIGFLTYLKNSLFIPDTGNVREVCWIFSNLAIGKPEQIRMLLAEPMLFQSLAKLCEHEDEALNREAIWTFCNMCLCKDTEVVQQLIDKGLIALFNSLLAQTKDIKVITLILEGVTNLIEFSGTLGNDSQTNFVKLMMAQGLGDAIEKLQYHQSDLLYLKAHMMLEMYFPLAN